MTRPGRAASRAAKFLRRIARRLDARAERALLAGRIRELPALDGLEKADLDALGIPCRRVAGRLFVLRPRWAARKLLDLEGS